MAKIIWLILALWGRLRRELAVFQGVGALDAGPIYLIGVNKSEGRGRAQSPVGQPLLSEQAGEGGLPRGVRVWALC